MSRHRLTQNLALWILVILGILSPLILAAAGWLLVPFLIPIPFVM